MSLLINKPGVLTTVQDLGRFGWRRFGVNPNGPMDPAAARIANILVGNDDNAAFLEMHFPAPEIVFERRSVFSFCGADLGAELNGQPVVPWQAVVADPGSTLRCAYKACGERAYLAVRGGIEVPSWLGSASTNLAAHIGGHKGRRIMKEDRLRLKSANEKLPKHLPGVGPSLIPRYSRSPTLRVIAGAELEVAGHIPQLTEMSFTISPDSDRMGFLLSGDETRARCDPVSISSAVGFGTIQLTPDGQMILLMADHQTTGGYPRIAHVASADLPLVGQLGPGDSITLEIIAIEEAERLALLFERDLSLLRVACRLAYE